MKRYIAEEVRPKYDCTDDEIKDLAQKYNLAILGNRYFISVYADSIKKACKKAYDMSCDEFIAELEAYAGKEYDYTYIRGDGQRDWQNVFYPTDTPKSILDKVEMLYFQKYTTFGIKERDEKQQEGIYNYTVPVPDTKDPIEYLCRQLSCTPDDLEVRVINGYITIPKYKTL